jgi:hypothetical protein
MNGAFWLRGKIMEAAQRGEQIFSTRMKFFSRLEASRPNIGI